LNKESSTDQIKQPKELQRAKGSNSKIILYLGFNGKYICTKMLDFGYNGFSFYTFSSAVLWLKNNLTTNAEMPVAIITDFALPDGNVFQFAQELKKDTNLRSISLIVLANNRSLEDRMKALRVGIDDFYINEFSAKKISQRIEFLEKYKGLTENTTPEIKPNLNSFFPKFEMPVFKRAFDIVFSTVLLIILSPLFLVIAILIKLESKGPVFYVSHRAGSGYKIFKFYKFRTMKLNAEKDLEKLLPLNKYHGWREDDFLFFKIDKDPRVTKFGNILRKTCLDELPQLINVLIGDMSMVGNRPLPLYEAERLTKDQFAKRFLAPAGITGLWQISKRDSSDFQEDYRMDLDLKYANQSSFWFDIKIIIKTIPIIFQGGAL
jgi:lipopolysaccharide/colanic/teichoic acid biosynthesis glycosyltransferase